MKSGVFAIVLFTCASGVANAPLRRKVAQRTYQAPPPPPPPPAANSVVTATMSCVSTPANGSFAADWSGTQFDGTYSRKG